MSDESRVQTVLFSVCDLCLSGAGGECHTPGCSFWLNRAPDLPLAPVLEAEGIVRVDTRDEALQQAVYDWITDGYAGDDEVLRHDISLVFVALAALAGER